MFISNLYLFVYVLFVHFAHVGFGFQKTGFEILSAHVFIVFFDVRFGPQKSVFFRFQDFSHVLKKFIKFIRTYLQLSIQSANFIDAVLFWSILSPRRAASFFSQIAFDREFLVFVDFGSLGFRVKMLFSGLQQLSGAPRSVQRCPEALPSSAETKHNFPVGVKS